MRTATSTTLLTGLAVRTEMNYPDLLRVRAETILDAIQGWDRDKLTIQEEARANAFLEIAAELDRNKEA